MCTEGCAKPKQIGSRYIRNRTRENKINKRVSSASYCYIVTSSNKNSITKQSFCPLSLTKETDCIDPEKAPMDNDDRIVVTIIDKNLRNPIHCLLVPSNRDTSSPLNGSVQLERLLNESLRNEQVLRNNLQSISKANESPEEDPVEGSTYC